MACRRLARSSRCCPSRRTGCRSGERWRSGCGGAWRMSEATTPLVAEETRFPLRGESRPAYFARPAGAGPFPGLIVIHEIYGLNENIRAVAQRFARQGYATLAVDLFAGRNRTFCTFRIFSQLMVGSLSNAT